MTLASRRLRLLLAVLPLCLMAIAVQARESAARCTGEDDVPAASASASAPPVAAPDASQPRLTLQTLVRRAVERSQGIGAAKLLAQAASAEVEQQQAAKLPQATLSGSFGPTYATAPDVPGISGGQLRAGVNISALLYDGGQTDELTGWRRNLAEAARLGQISAEEQVALQTVSLVLERSRYRMQARVYRQYERSVACLVDALRDIVAVDKGRASELVQAQKTLQQVELSQTDTASTLRQIEVRLRRFVGDTLPETEGMASVLLATPTLDDVLAQASRSSDITQLDAQAEALDSYARSVDASSKPQVTWNVGGSRAVGVGSSSSLGAGINVNVPLYAPTLRYAVDAAQKRAGAARLQRADALEARRYRIAEVHEQAASAFDRARRIAAVVNDSELVRAATVEQWQRLGRRSLFDVMAAEGDHYALRLAYVNALYDGEQGNALLRSLGLGIAPWLE
ncbi:MAG: TolC family protein [Proteobacteria bacterium]|nr:TolC family protein [Pseudomonadota bacterium]